MKEIVLTKGYTTLVDDEEYEVLIGSKWYAEPSTTVKGNIYARSRTLGFMHSFILDEDYVDHIDHNGLNNQKDNLRVSNPSYNGANRRKQRNPVSSTFKGVSWSVSSQKWKVQIQKNGQMFYLGMFKDEVEAAYVYNKAAVNLFGEHAALNQL